MPGYTIDNFFIYVVINATTSRPGNILASNTAGSHGWKKGKPLFFGMFAGYYIVQILCAVFIFGVSTFLPGVLRIMEYIGAAYILWLAIHIVISKPADDSGEKPASFIEGFLLQSVSVKIYLFGITALTGYITDYGISFLALLVAELTIATTNTTATLIWIGLGTLSRTVYQKCYHPIDIVLALALLECIYSMLK